MPTYQYRCTDCGRDLEVVQKFSDPTLTVCPTCQGSLRKVFNAVGVVFKGSGFYRTDSRKGTGDSGGSENGKGSDSGSKESSNGDKGTSTGGKDKGGADGKPATGASGSSGTSAGSGTPSTTAPAGASSTGAGGSMS